MVTTLETVTGFTGSEAIPGPTKVNGVRIYTVTTAIASSSNPVFYSRRGDGPYYRWLFEETVGKWRAARVVDAAFIRQTLSLATWKTVPEALQTRLGEHYLE
jgi:hypothetical protein